MCLLDITKGEKQPSKRTHTFLRCICVHAASKRTCDVKFVCHWFKALTFLQILCSDFWTWEVMSWVRDRDTFFFLSICDRFWKFDKMVLRCVRGKTLPQKKRWVHSIDELNMIKTCWKTWRIPLSTTRHGVTWYQTNLHSSSQIDISLQSSK